MFIWAPPFRLSPRYVYIPLTETQKEEHQDIVQRMADKMSFNLTAEEEGKELDDFMDAWWRRCDTQCIGEL